MTPKSVKVGRGPVAFSVFAAPVLQCRQCGEAELENVAMSRVDRLLAGVDRSTEWEVVCYAA